MIRIPLTMIKSNLKEVLFPIIIQEIRSKILISYNSVGNQHLILESRNILPKFGSYLYVSDNKNIQRP